MNLAQLSNKYQYLYSPKSWLHTKRKYYKTLYVFLQLLVIPHAHLQYIIITLAITFIVLRSLHLPNKVHQDIFITITFFSSVLIISTYYTTKKTYIGNINHFNTKIQPIIFLDKFVSTEKKFINQIIQAYFYICISTSRLILISLTYIFTIKIYLLTTNYEELMILLLKYKNHSTFLCNFDMPFIIILSSQFLKMTFNDIDKLKIAYAIRNLSYKNRFFTIRFIRICFFIIQSFFIRFYMNMQAISKSLHSRDLTNHNLYIANIYYD